MNNLRGFDLNLLVILDALLDEAHVSRAAHRLNLSQPAVSSALQRCRQLLGDPLLEREGAAMRRTSRAVAIQGQLKAVLADIRAVIDPPERPLSEIEQVIRIVAGDEATLITAPGLFAALEQSAPGLSLVFQPWTGAEAAARALQSGESDLAISVFPPVAGIAQTTLLEVDYVMAMREDHPAVGAMDLDRWLDWPHVVVSGRGARRTAVDDRLAAVGKRRRVGAVVPSFHLVPPLLAATHMVALLPRQMTFEFRPCRLVHAPPPLDIEGFPLHLAWHERRARDRAVQHVAKVVKALFRRREMAGPGGSF